MTLKATHPQYDSKVDQWRVMRILFEGEEAVKAAGEEFLPPTTGQILDGMGPNELGRKNYEAYKARAVFHDYVKDAVEVMIGLLHQKPPTIILPAALEPLRHKATVNGEGLDHLLRRINYEQLLVGRLGLLLDMPDNPDPANPMPYITLYTAEGIRNWDATTDEKGPNSLNLVVLDESGYVRENVFEWKHVTRRLVLVLGDPEDGEETAQYRAAVFEGEDAEFDEAQLLTPMYRGAPLNQIPFVFINARDITPDAESPPLMGLGRLALAIYRGEADYRQNLYMQGQETLVVIGGSKDEETRVGAGSKIEVDIGGDAKYIGVTSSGLSEQRQALENDKKQAELKAGQFIANKSNQESGEALRTRLAAQTATLNQIAQAGAAGLENLLKIAAVWMGADPDEVRVEPNTEYANIELGGEELMRLMTARSMGAPLSLETIHALMSQRGLTKLDFETELAKIEEEGGPLGVAGTGGAFSSLLPTGLDPSDRERESDSGGAANDEDEAD